MIASLNIRDCVLVSMPNMRPAVCVMDGGCQIAGQAFIILRDKCEICEKGGIRLKKRSNPREQLVRVTWGP